MEITETFYPKTRQEWRRWLAKNYQKKTEVWVVFYKAHTGKQRVSYNDAVEEALCFGWIDSIVKSLGEDRFVQRFSPRKLNTPYSQTNKERLKKLIVDGKVKKEVLVTLVEISEEKFEIADDILTAIRVNKQAWKNFGKFSDRYKRIRVGFIEGARRRPEEFKKRLNYFVKMTAANKQFGFGGVEKYF